MITALTPKSRDKTFGTKQNNQANQTGLEDLDFRFCVIFDHYFQSVASERSAEDQTMSPPKLEMFLIFPNFQRSQILKRWDTCELTLIQRF